MVNRPAGGARSQKWERSDYDWYIEPPRAVEQLLDGVDFGADVIWDPCCGRGNVLDVAKEWGHLTFGSDIIDRHPRHQFARGNALQLTRIPFKPQGDREVSIISNPPFSYEPDIAERIILHCIEAFNVRRAAFILPIAFLAGQERWGRILGRTTPSHVGIYRERHTMPPGKLIATMANPFAGGMADYCAVIFTRPHRWRTELIWLKPGHQIPRNLRPGSMTGDKSDG